MEDNRYPRDMRGYGAAPPAQSSAGGGALVVVGVVVLTGSVPALIVGAGSMNSSEGYFRNLGKFMFGMGIGGLALSAACIAPGVMLLENTRQGDPRKPEPSKPALEIGPGSARVRVAF